MSVSGAAKGAIAVLDRVNKHVHVTTLDDAWKEVLRQRPGVRMADFMKPSVRSSDELEQMGQDEKIAYSVTEAHVFLPSEDHAWCAQVMQAVKDKTIKRAQLLICWAMAADPEQSVFGPQGVVMCTSLAVKLTGGRGQI